MGTEAVWIPLVMAALGTGVSVYNQNQTAKKQDNTLAQQIRDQQAIQQKANSRTSQLINQQSQQTDQPQKQASQAQFANQLAANQPEALNPLKSVGAVSDAYKSAGANAAQGITSYGNNQADLLSSIAAPGQQRRENQKNLDDYSTDIGNLKTQLGGQDFLSQLKLQGIRQNPYLSAASGLLGAGAGAMSSGGGNYGAMMSALAARSAKPVTGTGYDYLNDMSNNYLGSGQ